MIAVDRYAQKSRKVMRGITIVKLLCRSSAATIRLMVRSRCQDTNIRAVAHIRTRAGRIVRSRCTQLGENINCDRDCLCGTSNKSGIDFPRAIIFYFKIRLVNVQRNCPVNLTRRRWFDKEMSFNIKFENLTPRWQKIGWKWILRIIWR